MGPKSTPKSPQNAPKTNNKNLTKKVAKRSWFAEGGGGRVNLKLAGDGKRKVCERWACCGDVFVVAAFC